MRYAQGGELTAEGRRRRELVRLEAARRFEQRAPAAVIAAQLRVSERSVRQWRQACRLAARPGWVLVRGLAARAGWCPGLARSRRGLRVGPGWRWVG